MSGYRGSVTEIMFREHRDGLVFLEEEVTPPIFMRLLPEGVKAAAGMQFFRVF